MKIIGLLMALVSIVVVFFNYNGAVLLVGVAMVFWGISSLKTKDNIMASIFLIGGLVFIIGMFIQGF